MDQCTGLGLRAFPLAFLKRSPVKRSRAFWARFTPSPKKALPVRRVFFSTARTGRQSLSRHTKRSSARRSRQACFADCADAHTDRSPAGGACFFQQGSRRRAVPFQAASIAHRLGTPAKLALRVCRSALRTVFAVFGFPIAFPSTPSIGRRQNAPWPFRVRFGLPPTSRARLLLLLLLLR